MKRLAWLLVAVLLALTACQSAIPVTAPTNSEEEAAISTLPPPEQPYAAPYGDADLTYSESATLYLPQKDGRKLIAKQIQLSFMASRHEAESIIRSLLTFPETEDTISLGRGIALQLTGQTPLELSNGVLTVNLAPSCLQLSNEDFYTLCQAITNSVTELADVRYVNILVAGVQVGMDIASMLPIGTLSRRMGEDLPSIYAQLDAQRVQNDELPSEKRFTQAATLYFPAAVGNGILPEVRTIAFEGQMPEQLAKVLVEELSLGAQRLPSMPVFPNITAFLASEPSVYIQAGTGGSRVAELRFLADLNEALSESNITRSALMASLTYTLTTFIPQLSSVEVFIGDEHITQVSPSSIYFEGESIHFQDGLQQRSDYARLLLAHATLYLAAPDNTGLVAVRRPIPYYEVRNPRYLMLQLAMGAQVYDDISNAGPVMPNTLKDADLLGFAIQDETLLVHLSTAFQESVKDYDERQEQLCVYAIINTLLEATHFKRMRIYIADTQPDFLVNHIYLPGVFFKNDGIVSTVR